MFIFIYYEVDLRKSDSYDSVLAKASRVVSLDNERAVLVSANGSVVSNDAFDIRGEQPWTLGAYLSKRRVSAETLKLGVAVIEKDNLKVGVQQMIMYINHCHSKLLYFSYTSKKTETGPKRYDY